MKQEYCEISKHDLNKLLEDENNAIHFYTDEGKELIISIGDVDDLLTEADK